MAEDPTDDVYRIIARAMEEFFSTLPMDTDHEIIGCTIIAAPGEDPKIMWFDEFPDDEVAYELIEGIDEIYITAKIPPHTESAPFADIRPDEVLIGVDDREIEIALPHSVHIAQSHYTVKNGIMDIVCRKLMVE